MITFTPRISSGVNLFRMCDIICDLVLHQKMFREKKGKEIDDSLYKSERNQHYPLLRRINDKADKMNFSFAGGGFHGIYHVGVAMCLKKYAPHLVNKISGASAGAMAACCLLCDTSLEDTMNGILNLSRVARKHVFGPFSPYFSMHHMLLVNLQKLLPDDAHIRVNGKLYISLTRVYDGKNVIVSQFESKEDIVQALVAASFVPVYSGFLAPQFHGIRYMDGGFSDNLPTFDEDTITVAPFCGESDICPRDPSLQLFYLNVTNMSVEVSLKNIHRIIQIFLPPEAEILSNVCWQGHDDALKFLHRRNLLK